MIGVSTDAEVSNITKNKPPPEEMTFKCPLSPRGSRSPASPRSPARRVSFCLGSSDVSDDEDFHHNEGCKGTEPLVEPCVCSRWAVPYGPRKRCQSETVEQSSDDDREESPPRRTTWPTMKCPFKTKTLRNVCERSPSGSECPIAINVRKCSQQST